MSELHTYISFRIFSEAKSSASNQLKADQAARRALWNELESSLFSSTLHDPQSSIFT